MINIIKNEIKKVIVGQDELCDSMLIALLSNGHILVEGVPGIAKTTAVKSLGQSLGLTFKRIQFTPDLLPSDITGNEILDMKNNEFKVKHGPIFTNLLLADEINRAGAKVQSALLEAMAENQVTIGEETFKLEEPFMVLATANPVEQDGTYELPEASLDRFMLKVEVGYNNIDEEFEIVQRVANKGFETINQVLNVDELKNLKQQVHDIHIDDEVSKYILKIIFATREPENYDLEEISQYIEFGASPRGSIDLYKACKAYAFIQGKDFVTPADVAKSAYLVLRHRIILNYEAQADDITVDNIIKKILQKIPTP
ncbi:MAG: MoxR family ATPase [Campylobacteraceae bacterium]|jgi:MoxR-like ATPase|nr:MoxR family ATPase [Campylobacteraceae bacterium]MBT3883081.1 MoxR family ATPase [Campylobacteraceae bacterium]MBT4030190.1 MoxR family ATPase [Campylobacteraceae bacterium]MBT4178762.1 MoxR family ATPase [Campylobacteraceae bacterium]MBT4572712.1 MoxR family ATPase [Campylobacteraceae bacterium]